VLKQIHGRQNHSRRADAALRAAAFDERLLHSVKVITRRHAFDGFNLSAFDLRHRYQTTVDDPAIDHDAARAAFTFAATFLRSGKTQLLAQYVQQALHGIGVKRLRRFIDPAVDFNLI
jgi:hypothetical protein